MKQKNEPARASAANRAPEIPRSGMKREACEQAKRRSQVAFHVPAALEIVRCNEGGKEYIKEKRYKHETSARYVLVAEFPINFSTNEEISAMKRLAKRFARDYIRTAHALAAVVRWNACGAGGGTCLQVLDKYNGGLAAVKIKALAAFCKKTETVFLLDEKSEDGERIVRQYIQTGTALYPLDGMPILNEETLLAILDVPQDERSSWQVNRVDAAVVRKYTADNMEDDREAELVGLTFGAGGYDVQPLYTPFGMVTINAETRKPIANNKKTAQYFARRDPDSKHITIIVKNGFMLVAAISPIQKWVTEKTAEYLTDIAQHAEKLLMQNAAEETKRESAADGKEPPAPRMRPFGLLPAPQPKLEDENRRGIDDLLS